MNHVVKITFNEGLLFSINGEGVRNRKRIYQLVLCVLLFFWDLTLSYADEEISLPEISVISPKHANNNNTDEIGQITEFNRSSLNNANAADLNGLLRGQGGVGLAQSNSSMTSTLVLRGAGGGLGLVTLDGVPLFNSLTSFFPLSHYPLDFLGRVNVSRGFAGEDSSSRTLGGSINLYTRQLGDGQGFLRAEGGSYGTVRGNLGEGYSTKMGNLTLAAGRSDIFQGISQAPPPVSGGSDRNDFQMTNAMVNWSQEFERGSLGSSLYFVHTNEGMGGPGLQPNGKIAWLNEPNGNVIQNTWVTQSHGSYQINNSWTSNFRLGYTQDQQVGMVGNILGTRLPMDLTSQLWIGRWENNHSMPLDNTGRDALNLSWGLEAQQQHADSPLNPAKIYTLTNNLLSPVARTLLNWGIWRGQVEFRFDDYTQYGNHGVFKVSNNWQLESGVSLWANGGTGFRAPAVNERLHPIFGNFGIAPEKNAGGETGLRWQVATNSEISVSGYFQHYNNLISLNQSAATGVISTLNIPQARMWGADFQAKHQWRQDWKSGISYTYMDIKNLQVNAVVPVRPQNQGQFWTEWQVTEPLKIRLDLNYRDSYFADTQNSIKIQAAARLNAKIEYQIHPKLGVYVRGENITDNRTPDLLGFNYVGAAVYGGGNLNW